MLGKKYQILGIEDLPRCRLGLLNGFRQRLQ